MLRLRPKLPDVSVIIPVYNQEKYIKECLESVIEQEYEKIEIIVIDDGSTDATPQIVNDFDSKIKYIRQENQGSAAAVNNGIKVAQGSLICWLGSDDVYLAGKIYHQVDLLLREPSLSAVYSDYIMIDSDGKEITKVKVPWPSPEQFARSLLIRNFINGSAVMMRRECFDKTGYYDETLMADADADMWFRLLKHGYKFGYIPKPLIKYRWHSNNISHNRELMRKCKDAVRLKVMQEFTPRQLFGDIISSGGAIDKAYEEIAIHLFRDFNFKSAEEALLRSQGGAFLGLR